MYIYNKPYRSAFEAFNDQYLTLFLGTIISIVGFSIILKMKSYTEALSIYMCISGITLIIGSLYWYYMELSKIKRFTLSISGNEIEICKQILPTKEISNVYTTENGALLIITSKMKYKIYKSLQNYDDLLNTLNAIIPVQKKSDKWNRIIYALDLALFITFLLVNIPYVVIMIGLYLMFSYINQITKSMIRRYLSSFLINVLMFSFITYKLIQAIRMVITK